MTGVKAWQVSNVSRSMLNCAYDRIERMGGIFGKLPCLAQLYNQRLQLRVCWLRRNMNPPSISSITDITQDFILL
jgi:hypothetical protein